MVANNSSGHAISVDVTQQWTLQHRVFAYSSFVKSESIIETHRLFVAVSISGVMGTFQVAIPS